MPVFDNFRVTWKPKNNVKAVLFDTFHSRNLSVSSLGEESIIDCACHMLTHCERHSLSHISIEHGIALG